MLVFIQFDRFVWLPLCLFAKEWELYLKFEVKNRNKSIAAVSDLIHRHYKGCNRDGRQSLTVDSEEAPAIGESNECDAEQKKRSWNWTNWRGFIIGLASGSKDRRIAGRRAG